MVPVDSFIKYPMLDALTHVATGVLSLKCIVGLIAKPFTPNKNGTLPDDFEADFSGYAVVERASVDAQLLIDPVSGLTVIRLPPPAGGWMFVADGGIDAPQPIYGYYLTIGVEDADPHFPITASAAFDTPRQINEVGDFVSIPDVFFTMPSVYLF